MVKDVTTTDGAVLATSVRTLARRAHRVLSAKTDHRQEAHSVARQVSLLQTEVQGHGSTNDLRRWLDRLQQQLGDLRA